MYLPRTAELSAILAIAFAGIVTPIILSQLLVSVVAYAWVQGTTQAHMNADRAKEIAMLERDFALQAEAVAHEKRRLDASLKTIVTTLLRVANEEDFDARVPLTRENVLWQVSGFLNNLLSYVQRLRQDAIQLEQVKLALKHAREENAQIIATLRKTAMERGAPAMTRSSITSQQDATNR
jgi:hypothetical protein